MRRDQLEHAIRAAATVIGDDEVIVIGSQSILASIDADRLPPAATMSIEVDLMPVDGDEGKADLIDGVMGEGSQFQETHGFYGDVELPGFGGHLILGVTPEEGGPDGSSSEVPRRVPS